MLYAQLHKLLLCTFSSVLDAESNLRPIWLTELGCTSADSNLPACILEENIIGYADCQSSSRSIAAIDCGECTLQRYLHVHVDIP